MPSPSPDRAQEFIDLLTAAERGGHDAVDRLMPVVYAELRELASAYLRRERPDHTLQTTALVHEAYLRLTDQHRTTWQNRSHFLGVAAQAMRRILVDHARGRHRLRREGGRPVTLEEGMAVDTGRPEEVLAVDEALVRLAALDPRQARIVELRYFAGLTIEETASALELSPATVKREWTSARAWLLRELQ
jgi:RNA polymerase sigma factor (TIGR02999 family)